MISMSVMASDSRRVRTAVSAMALKKDLQPISSQLFCSLDWQASVSHLVAPVLVADEIPAVLVMLYLLHRGDMQASDNIQEYRHP